MAPFPPILAVALGTLAAAFVVRHITREWQRAKDIDREANASVGNKDESVPKKLRRDPDGIYRP